MKLSPKLIEEFRAIVRDEFGIELSDEEALIHATRMLELMWSLVQNADEPARKKEVDPITPPLS